MSHFPDFYRKIFQKIAKCDKCDGQCEPCFVCTKTAYDVKISSETHMFKIIDAMNLLGKGPVEGTCHPENFKVFFYSYHYIF
jgi:hypothetical protein